MKTMTRERFRQLAIDHVYGLVTQQKIAEEKGCSDQRAHQMVWKFVERHGFYQRRLSRIDPKAFSAAVFRHDLRMRSHLRYGPPKDTPEAFFETERFGPSWRD